MSRRFALTWDFVEQHYPDYHRCQTICTSGDMSACFEYAGLNGSDPVTEQTVSYLKGQASDAEPSYQQVCAFDDFIGSGKTFSQAHGKSMIIALQKPSNPAATFCLHAIAAGPPQFWLPINP